jgi:hypothetical protein
VYKVYGPADPPPDAAGQEEEEEDQGSVHQSIQSWHVTGGDCPTYILGPISDMIGEWAVPRYDAQRMKVHSAMGNFDSVVDAGVGFLVCDRALVTDKAALTAALRTQLEDTRAAAVGGKSELEMLREGVS